MVCTGIGNLCLLKALLLVLLITLVVLGFTGIGNRCRRLCCLLL
jgi:hypothetical protein